MVTTVTTFTRPQRSTVLACSRTARCTNRPLRCTTQTSRHLLTTTRISKPMMFTTARAWVLMIIIINTTRRLICPVSCSMVLSIPPACKGRCLLNCSLLAGLSITLCKGQERQQKQQPQTGYERHERVESSRLSLLVSGRIIFDSIYLFIFAVFLSWAIWTRWKYS